MKRSKRLRNVSKTFWKENGNTLYRNVTDREYTDLKERIAFLESQISVKDDQIKVKDEQIMNWNSDTKKCIEKMMITVN